MFNMENPVVIPLCHAAQPPSIGERKAWLKDQDYIRLQCVGLAKEIRERKGES
jgi:hypothetical protein